MGMTGTANAKDFHLLSVDRITVDVWETRDGKRDAYLPEYDALWKRGAAFNVNLRLAEIFSWTNRLHMEGGEYHLFAVGWEFQVTMDRYPVQPFIYHHSQHGLDGNPSRNEESNRNRFPVVDRYGFRFVFMEKK